MQVKQPPQTVVSGAEAAASQQRPSMPRPESTRLRVG